jgi:hypothetical protein
MRRTVPAEPLALAGRRPQTHKSIWTRYDLVCANHLVYLNGTVPGNRVREADSHLEVGAATQSLSGMATFSRAAG